MLLWPELVGRVMLLLLLLLESRVHFDLSQSW